MFLLPLEYPGTDPLDTADDELPSFRDAINYKVATGLLKAGQTATATQLFTELATPTARAEIISLDDDSNNVIRINPLTPLQPKTKYLVVITDKVEDANGKPLIASPGYQNYADPSQPLGIDDLQAFRDAIISWETLASGYFSFMQSVFDQVPSLGATAPTKDDIVFSITFTTTAVDDVLEANAAPRTFFKSSQEIAARHDAINKLTDGSLNLSNQPVNTGDAADSAINGRIYQLLTDPTQGFRLFNADLASTLAQANAGSVSVSYNDVVVGTDGKPDTTLAFVLQTAAAQAAIDVKGSTIDTQVASVEGAFVSSLGALEAPTDRVTNFFDTGRTASDLPGGVLSAPAKISQGEITLPYFQGIPASNTISAGKVIVSSSWTSNQEDNLQDPPIGSLPDLVAPSDKVTYRFPFAGKTGNTTVPVVVTYPDQSLSIPTPITKPASGWPVIIYQHGITTDRSATLPMADALAFACRDATTYESTEVDCFATVAIDQPLHGITSKGGTVPGLTMVKDQNGNVEAGASATATERHFNFSADADLNPTPLALLPDSAEASGSLFINLSNFVNSRDNLRQGVLDLLNLNASLADMDIDGDPSNGPDLDTSRVYFIGHSLGGVNGIPFVAVNNAVQGEGVNASLPKIQAAAILNSGGNVTRLLENSPSTSFGAPAILQGLKKASDGVLVQGTSALETYFAVLQGLVDSTDPVNFGASLSSSNLLLTEIVGDASNPSDQTIPNAADADLYGKGPLDLILSNGFEIHSLPAPLAGTEPTIAQIGAKPTADGTLPAVTRFTEGTHGTPVSVDNVAVFQEMVSEVAQLFSTGSITVTNPSVVE